MSAARTSGGSQLARALTWDTAVLAPIVLVQGAEGLLVDRALDSLGVQSKTADSQTEKTTLTAAAYQSGMLSFLTSPSLFGEPRLVVIDNLETTTDALITDVIDYLENPAPDVWLVLAHRGGVRGKKMLDALKKSGFPVIVCEPIKRDGDKLIFATAEFKRAGRRATQGAVRALVEALGSDLRELGAACNQLMADTTGTIDENLVDKYYGGRVEATGFKVADAALAGDSASAIQLLRHALATGADPVPIVAALAMKLRTLAKVAGLRSGHTANQIGLVSWQIDRARKDLSNWTPDGLALAITAVAQADAEVKGAGRDPVFAVERAVLTITRAWGK